MMFVSVARNGKQQVGLRLQQVNRHAELRPFPRTTVCSIHVGIYFDKREHPLGGACASSDRGRFSKCSSRGSFGLRRHLCSAPTGGASGLGKDHVKPPPAASLGEGATTTAAPSSSAAQATPAAAEPAICSDDIPNPDPLDVDHVHAPGSMLSAVDPLYSRFTACPISPTPATGAAAGQLRQRFTAQHSEQPHKHHTHLYDITQTAVEIAQLTASNAKYYTDVATGALNKQYLNLEETLLQRITAKNRRNVRVVLLSIIAAIVLVIFVFGNKIRQKVTTSTASIAKETLENESLKNQTQELAMAVVQTILTDKEVTIQAANFLREASQTPETQAALLALTLHCLRHPESLDSLQALVQELLVRLADDPAARAAVVAFGGHVCADEQLLAHLNSLVLQLVTDPALNDALNKILVSVLSLPEVGAAATAILNQSAKELLQDAQLKSVTRDFITQVVGDTALQRESGAALYNSITHALTPGTIKMAGVGVIALSVAFIEVMISGY